MTIRDLVPHPNARPCVAFTELDLHGPLPDDVITHIQGTDTVFLGASYTPDMDTQAPLHVETNIRGGRSGFVRVSPMDGRTIVLPDFSGAHPLHVQPFFLSCTGNDDRALIRKPVNYVTRQ